MLIPREFMNYENLDALASVFEIYRMDKHPGIEPRIPADRSATDLTGEPAVMWDIFMEKLVLNGYKHEFGGPYVMQAFTGLGNPTVDWLPWACKWVPMVSVSVRHPIQENPDINLWPIYIEVRDHEHSLEWHVSSGQQFLGQDLNMLLRKRCMLLRTLADIGVLPPFQVSQ